MPPKQNQARKRAVNTSNSKKKPQVVFVNAPRPRPKPQKPNTSDSFRNTRNTSSAVIGGVTKRQKGVYALAEVTADALQLSISPTGIRRFMEADSALSLLLQAHEQYFVHSIGIEFIPELAVTEPGSLHLSPDWDPLDTMPADAMSMSSDLGYVSGPITKKLIMRMPNPRAPDGSYTRPMLFTSANVIERLTDYGLVNLRTTGVTAIGTIGRLLMHWDISFHLPQIPQPITITTNSLITTLAVTTPTHTQKYRLSPLLAGSTDTLLEADSNLTVETVYSAIFDDGVSVGLFDTAGQAIKYGSRIFFEAARHLLSTDGTAGGLDLASYATTTFLGAIGSSRTMQSLYNYVIRGASGGTISLRDVRVVSN